MSVRQPMSKRFCVSFANIRIMPRTNGIVRGEMDRANCKRWKGTVVSRRRTFAAWFAWYGIPSSLGILCLALVQLRRTLKREEPGPASPQPVTWQLWAFSRLPSRSLSRVWGKFMEWEIWPWLRRPLLGLYVWTYKCNMDEALVGSVHNYASFQQLFTRKLHPSARLIDDKHELVSPTDGKVLHFGKVNGDSIEQVKGVCYSLEAFLGPCNTQKPQSTETSHSNDSLSQDRRDGSGKELFHIIIYLAPGDCHHFHSPAMWTINTRRHFHGELLTVAPWAAKKMPGLFALNERVVLLGEWQHGLFAYGAVGAYNVGSINLSLDEELRTNKKGMHSFGSFLDKSLGAGHSGLCLQKGDHIGVFNLGSSIVLIFEAPSNFKFQVKPGQRVRMGQAL